MPNEYPAGWERGCWIITLGLIIGLAIGVYANSYPQKEKKPEIRPERLGYFAEIECRADQAYSGYMSDIIKQ